MTADGERRGAAIGNGGKPATNGHSVPAPEMGAFLPFAPNSMIRRVHGEGILLLGGGRALLMQIAHPAVARGVQEHSSFRKDRRKRLLRTLRPMFAIAFGSKQQALDAAAMVNHLHEDVVGPGYRATDPDLLLWVLATLIDSALFVHERFLRPLRPAETEAYYADMLLVGELLGIPPGYAPSTYKAFRAYFDTTLESLRVSNEARGICRDLFRGLLVWPVMLPVRQLTSGLLPSSLREQFGLPWGPRRERWLRRIEFASRRLLPFVPRRWRRPPWFVMPGEADGSLKG